MHDIHDFKTHNIPRCLWPGRCCPHYYPLGHKIFGGDAVNAHDLFKKAADSGVALYLDGQTLKARGCRQAVEILSPELREHKAALVDWLNAASDPSRLDANSRLVGLSRFVLPVAEKLAEPDPAPELPPDPNAWRELAAAYHRHHFKCPACIAAGRGAGYGLRCGVGAALWRAYSDTTEPPANKGRP